MARKRLGQHFLRDLSVRERILRLAALCSEDTVLEVGAGKGVLTRALARRAGRVAALELDRALADSLRKTFAEEPRVEVLTEDALAFDPRGLGPGVKVVANLPYYAASAIILHLLSYPGFIADMILMIQKEVAERITAGPGGKDYGSLSLQVQYRADASQCFTVPARAFRPMPKVDSAVLRITPLSEPRVKVADEEFFFRMVRAAFAHRRKTLQNNLKRFLMPDVGEKTLREVLSLARIDPGRRGETLSLLEFARLGDLLWERLSGRQKP